MWGAPNDLESRCATGFSRPTTAGLSSTPTCWPTMPKYSASRIRATWARYANFGFTYSASRCGSHTGLSAMPILASLTVRECQDLVAA
jgi:hypothetical protein